MSRAREQARGLLRTARRSPLLDRVVLRVRWGGLRRLQPEDKWGYERGMPVDRWYIERFLHAHRALIVGHVLEVKEDLYASRFGAERVAILDIDPTNSRATLVGDLCNASTLPAEAFQAAVITQTLQFIPDPVQALRHLMQSLRSGGHLLLTVPALSRTGSDEDMWRWTAAGLRRTLTDADAADAEVVAHGNALSCRSFLAGLGAGDLAESVLRQDDPSYPLLVTAVVRKA